MFIIFYDKFIKCGFRVLVCVCGLRFGEVVGVFVLVLVVSAGVYSYMDYREKQRQRELFEEMFGFELELKYYRDYGENLERDNYIQSIKFVDGWSYDSWEEFFDDFSLYSRDNLVNVTRLELREIVEEFDPDGHFFLYYDGDEEVIFFPSIDDDDKPVLYAWWDS